MCVYLYICACVYTMSISYYITSNYANPIKKSTKDLHLEFTKEDRQMAYKVKKNTQLH